MRTMLRKSTIWGTGIRMLCVGGLGLAFAGSANAGLMDIFGACDKGCGEDICCESVCEDSLCSEDLCCEDIGCGAECGDCDWCDLGEPYTLMDALCDCPDQAPFQVYGWTQWGYTSNSTGNFNDYTDRFQNNQSYLVVERVADGSCGLDIGGRADIVYGTDAPDTQAFGNNPGVFDNTASLQFGEAYGWAFPQLYAEAAYGDFSVIGGHFYTLVGYEVVTAPDNFFYSHAFTQYNSEPFTHTGVLGTYSGMDDVELYGGWVLGWDTGFDQFDDGNGFLGGASVSVTDDATVTYILFAGDSGFRGAGYNHSIVADVALTDNLNYVFQSDFVSLDGDDGEEYGVNQYLFYTINDCLAVGGRAEWWHTDNGGAFDAYNYTFGANIRPQANVVVRPEIRYQNASDINEAEAFLGGDFDSFIFGTDVILTF
ncbi:outer membrane beta-barrel protein [Stratiformator vulcanicus]|uniref:Porin n=1 Tax=Stratiformator vulcanicus TaxID=2527980 RepID=A0A517QWA0_9PLAN|nr:outer membrane beta-barrel protein [Stratiformator vulcanicus]QDT35945.1 hypothetical protein Pan189_02990 [Stratiformator vulcanicus]